MTPKEKANDLLRKYWNSKFNMHIDLAIKCALIAVDEIINSQPCYPMAWNLEIEIDGIVDNAIFPSNYWQEVKQEIEKL